MKPLTHLSRAAATVGLKLRYQSLSPVVGDSGEAAVEQPRMLCPGCDAIVWADVPGSSLRYGDMGSGQQEWCVDSWPM